MTLKLITPATELPVSLDTLKAHLNGIPSTDQDADLSAKLAAAMEYIEGETRRALITSTWSVTREHWPLCGYITLPLGNLQSVSSITYRCPDGTVKTWASTNYRIERVYTPASDGPPQVTGNGPTDCGMGRIYLGYGLNWPADTLDVGEPITITFTCGWGAAVDVPMRLKQAIELTAATLYRSRESVTEGTSSAAYSALKLSGDLDAVTALCSRYVDRRF